MDKEKIFEGAETKMPEQQLEKPKPIVERTPWFNGSIYVLYFPDEASAEDLITKFWLRYTKGEAKRNFDSGMLKPTEHTITMGPRTAPRKLFKNELENYPGMNFRVEFNGNTNELSPKAEEILREVLQEEGLI